jgi:heptose-I-phosphate ethanolaminephosphotransferase
MYPVKLHFISLFSLILPYLALRKNTKNKTKVYKIALAQNTLILALFSTFVTLAGFLASPLILTSLLTIFTIVLVLLTVIELFTAIKLGSFLNSNFVHIVLETNRREIIEFMSSYKININFRYISVLLIPVLVLLIPLDEYAGQFFALIFVASICSVFMLSPIMILKQNVIARVLNIVLEMYKEHTQFQTKKNTHIDPFGLKQSTVSSPNIIIIIGESLNRNRMSLYGYERDTTPNLNKYMQSDRLFVFEDVISTNSYTRQVLPKLLTFYHSQSQKHWTNHADLISIYKSLDYKTFWISNQESSGVCGGSVSSTLASYADMVHFQSNDKNHFDIKDTFDEVLLKHLEHALEDSAEKKLIVVHLMGSHFTYKNRYPQSFDRFEKDDFCREHFKKLDISDESKMDIYNEYDNSVLYNDYVVSRMFDLIDKSTDNYLSIYLSDHGEEVYESRDYMGHNQETPSRHMCEIPFMLYVSREYKSNNHKKINNLYKNLRHPSTSDQMIHTVMDLIGVTHQSLVKEYSLTSEQPVKLKRSFMHLDYDESLKETDISYKNNPKFLMHRVDTLDKLEEAKKEFCGFETDIYIEHGQLVVKHSRSDSTKLLLKELLEPCPKEMKIWLDFKNLDSMNVIDVKKQLLQLLKDNRIANENVICECNVVEPLEYLSDTFFVSFYLPYLSLEEMQNDTLAKDLIEVLYNRNVDAISFPGYMLKYVQTKIHPSLPKLELLTWFESRHYFTDINEYDRLNNLIKSDDIKIILLSSRTVEREKKRRAEVAKKKLQISYQFSKNINAIVNQIGAINDDGKSVILYGAGIFAKLIYPLFNDIKCVVDSDKSLNGEPFYTHRVAPVEDICVDTDIVVVTVLGRENIIVDNLIKEYKIDRSKIFVFDLR